MKHIDLDKPNQNNERIQFLLAELNSTLDLYDENVVDNDTCCSEH